MKKIAHPDLKSAVVLKPLEMNGIHFGGIRTVLTPGDLELLGKK